MQDEQFSISLRYYFSAEALVSAYMSANNSIDIICNKEDLKEGKIDVEYTTNITNSIVSSVIFMEAAINEFFLDVLEAESDSLIGVNNLAKEAICRIKEFLKIDRDLLEKETILSKYNLALFLLEKETFDPGREPYQSAKALIDFRNHLVHFKSRTIEMSNQTTSSLENTLRGKFNLHPLSNDSIDSIYYPFPKSHFSHTCAKWAVESSRNFVEDFFRRINLQPVYLNPVSDLQQFLTFKN